MCENCGCEKDSMKGETKEKKQATVETKKKGKGKKS